jgi:hypothetical protein
MLALTSPSDTTEGSGRAFRGLILVFFLSLLNLAGVILTVAALGGLAPWTAAQFVGAFGVLELASGLANVLTPNLWHLPVAEFETSDRTDVKLAWSALALPHWGGLARCAAGLVCLAVAGYAEGVAPVSLLLVPFILALAWSILAVSALLARLGVARPDLDVFQLLVRWGKREKESRPISIGAAFLQFVLSVVTIPIVKLLPPSVLYQPELGPSRGALLTALAVAGALVPLVYFSWSGRIDWQAPREQQREAEEHA